MATVYRFEAWNILTDCFHQSMRWATKEAIKDACGRALGDGIEVDDRFIGREIEGMTERGFDPRHPL
jgi:hypothetical protein